MFGLVHYTIPIELKTCYDKHNVFVKYKIMCYEDLQSNGTLNTVDIP